MMVTDTEAIIDIESNRTESLDDPRNAQATVGKTVENVLRSLGLASSDSNKSLVKTNDIESLINDKFEGEKRENTLVIGKTQSKEKTKTKNSKKAPKPPRPRKGPSLSASDLRLVKEISELVMKKRARIERLRSLKKARSARLTQSSSSSSSNTSLFALMVTVLFLIVIIFQGFGSRF